MKAPSEAQGHRQIAFQLEDQDLTKKFRRKLDYVVILGPLRRPELEQWKDCKVLRWSVPYPINDRIYPKSAKLKRERLVRYRIVRDTVLSRTKRMTKRVLATSNAAVLTKP